MASLTYLITGANRGLGRALTEAFLARDSTTVIAAVRDLDHQTTKALLQLPAGQFSRLILVKIASTSPSDAQEAVDALQSTHGITALDVVIANAGSSTGYPLVADAQPEDLLDTFAINVVGPLLLFQATRPLLLASKNDPRFIAMSSAAGSIGGMELAPVPNASYGTSKAALNYLTRKMHFENEGICAFSIHPGWVQTDMGNAAAIDFGVPSGKADISIEESVKGLLSVFDQAKRATHSGKFLLYDGSFMPW